MFSANVVEAAEVNDGPGRRHRQGEGLRRRVRVGVGRRDGDRVASRRCPPAGVPARVPSAPRDTPEGSGPDSV